MKWWGYVAIVSSFALLSYIVTHFQAVKGFFGEIATYFAVRSQKYYIKNFAFDYDGEILFFDYLVINHAGVFAVSVHNLKGDIHLLKGRILLKSKVERGNYLYFNPVPHDVRKIIKLNKFVPEDTDIIPVIVFPRSNDKKIRAMWLTPVKELKNVFNEQCEKPLTEERIESLYENLNSIKIKSIRAKKKLLVP